MGIPIGCGSLMLFVLVGMLWQSAHAGFSWATVLRFVAGIVSALVVGAGVLVVMGRSHDTLNRR